MFCQLDWQITIAGAVVPRDNHGLSTLPQRILNIQFFYLKKRCLPIWALLCAGNSDTYFVGKWSS